MRTLLAGSVCLVSFLWKGADPSTPGVAATQEEGPMRSSSPEGALAVPGGPLADGGLFRVFNGAESAGEGQHWLFGPTALPSSGVFIMHIPSQAMSWMEEKELVPWQPLLSLCPLPELNFPQGQGVHALTPCFFALQQFLLLL